MRKSSKHRNRRRNVCIATVFLYCVGYSAIVLPRMTCGVTAGQLVELEYPHFYKVESCGTE
jgi:hypothetical protein